MARCELKGSEGDALQAMLFAACYNTRWLLWMIDKKSMGLLLYRFQLSGFAGLVDKLAEIIGLNRPQNSDLRWVMA